MILNYILIVSLVVHASAEVLKVKCADEKCEYPGISAVTTLRYAPDKSYKLPINAVNSDVDIYGMTDDLYFCRHGRNFGFLPKKHLREKSGGKFPFDVSIDLTSKVIDQTMREQNFLSIFVTSSQPEIQSNDTKNSSDQKIDLPEVKNVPETLTEQKPVENLNNVPSANNDSPKQDEKTEAFLDPQAKTEAETDSGVEDNDNDDEDDEDDDDNEEVVKTTEKPQQPELIAIPPSINKIEELATPTPAKSDEPKKAAEIESEIKIEEPPKVSEDAPKINEEPPKVFEEKIATENSTAEIQVSDPTAQQEATTEKAPVLDSTTQQPTEKVQETTAETTIPTPSPVQENDYVSTTILPEGFDVLDVNDTIPQEVQKDPAPVNEIPFEINNLQESTTELPPIESPSTSTPEIVIPIVTETPKVEEKPTEEVTPEVETTTEIPKQEETTAQTIPVEFETSTIPPIAEVIEITTPQPETVEIPTYQPVVEEITTEKPAINPSEPDALMKRLRQKLDNRVKDDKKPNENFHHHHHHSHGHDHSHSSHGHSEHPNHEHPHQDHSHSHIHEEVKTPESHIKSIDEKEENDDDEPGFFGGLYKKFFSSSEENEEVNDVTSGKPTTTPKSPDEGFCEKIDSENCPKHLRKRQTSSNIVSDLKSTDELIKIMLTEMIENIDLIISLGLTAVTILIFTLGYYCISKAKKEGPLIAKINELERHLMASVKENEIVKGDIISTKQKLMSIEDNSFGSNDMVVALKKEMEVYECEKSELLEKIESLESQLETATEDALELNKMVSELLNNNQSGSETILNTVEELQRQLNEQQETIATVNETLAAKSRENSELLMQLASIEDKHDEELRVRQQGNDAMALERNNLLIELENLKRETDAQVNQLVEERNSEVSRLNHELTNYIKKYDESNKNFIAVESKSQALEECLNAMKKESKSGEFKEIFDIADLKADLLAVSKEKSTMQDKLQNEKDARKLLEDRVKAVSEEMSNLKIEFGVAEKEKLEAQTRLEVLSTYFKDKETQLQKELSLKEALWMKSQGETTSTVEKIQTLNNEVQQLKSQNDSLRAEIEAQAAAHKLNISSHEAQSHTAWLNARQAERRLEESRMEAATLRRRLTSIAENPAGASDVLNGLPGVNEAMNSIPSPIRVDSPNNPNPLPPPPMMMPPFLPTGFMPGAPPPFLPPFMHHPGDLPPLGRLMSPPPKRFTPMRDERDRYSPRGRGRYSPDSRYDDDYTAFETETDYSPPPSPSPPRVFHSDRSKKSKGGNSSTGGSVDSNPRRKK